MKVITVFVICLAVVVANAKFVQPNQRAQEFNVVNSDQFFDDLIGNVEDSMFEGGYDNINLPGGGFDFTIRIGIINQKGRVDCSQGSLKGIQTMRRSSSANITPLPNGELRVEVTVVIPKASVAYTCGASFIGVNYSFTVTGSVDNVAIKLVIIVNKSGGVRLEEFSQSGSGSTNLSVPGLPSILQPINDQLTKWVGETTATIISQIINQTIAGFVGQALADTLFPVPTPSP